VTSNYTYDGLSQLLASGMTTLRGAGLDEVYAQIASGTAVSYLQDGNGNVAALTSAAQATVTGYSYGAYGATASTGPSGPATTATPFEYTGAEYNPNDQLLYLRNRFYSPRLGRFVSEDPIKLAGGVNTYAYANGNPISLRDPIGLWVPPSLPQGVVDVGVGFGEGVIAALTLGRVGGQDIRDLFNIPDNGGADTCSASYRISYVAGVADALVAEGGSFAAAAGVRSAARAAYVSFELLTGGAEVAGTGEEVTSAMEQLEEIVEAIQEESAEAPLKPPPGVPNFRY